MEKRLQGRFSELQGVRYFYGKKLMEMHYHPKALIFGSRAPIKRRWENSRLGHEPLKRELDEFCRERGIKPISAFTTFLEL